MAGSVIEMVQRFNDDETLAVDIPDPEWSVFEVPASLRAKCPASFQNKGLELGLHHRTLTNSQTEVFKVDLARVVHSKLVKRQSSWESFADRVVGDVALARRAYNSASSAKFSDGDVCHLLALDALFLVVLFKYINGRGLFLEEFDPFVGRLGEILPMIDRTDFFLIENQVPMYLLQSVIRQLCEIGDEAAVRRLDDPTFQIESMVEDELEMIINVAVLQLYPFTFPENVTSMLRGCLFWSQQPLQTRTERLHRHLISTYPVVPLEKSLINCQHLLDCIYTVSCGHKLPFNVEQAASVGLNLAVDNIPSATRLKAVGIRVVGTTRTVSDVSLRGKGYWRCAELQLPKVALYDYSEAAFHNLALHEQLAFRGRHGDFLGYLNCMASLCMDVSDLQILSEQGVIINKMGKATILDVWDQSRKGISTSMSLSSTWVNCNRRIYQHRNARLKRWRQECWTLFFAKPWTLVSVLAAIILLFLTATQTYLTAFPPSRTENNSS